MTDSTTKPRRVANRVGQWRDAVLDDGRLNAGEKVTAMAIARFADSTELKTFAAAPRLADASGFCERTVRTHVLTLIDKGWLQARGRLQQSRAWATRELVLLFPDRGAATVAAPQVDGPATVAAPLADGAANSSARSGKKRPMVRQNLPTISKRSRKNISGEPGRPATPNGAGRRGRSETDQKRIDAVISDLLGKGFEPARIIEFENLKRHGVTIDEVMRVP